jgi:hypothetical protein
LRAPAEAALGIGITKTQIVETILQRTSVPTVRNSLVAIKDLLA